MKIPYSWLAELVPLEVSPERLGQDLTFRGLALEGLEKVGGETVLDLDITTNRVDCMNVYGVAREAAALYGLPLRPLDTSAPEAGTPSSECLGVTISAPDLCGRFCARVMDVTVGPSPAWLRDRLELVGIRAINNVVDLSNYVMIEMGQPTHAFDLAKVPGGTLNVRWSRDGEVLETLDGVSRTLPAQIGLITGADGQPPLALAGVMGGASSEVTGATKSVALEAAWWEPLAVRRGARRLAMHTEASHRFERGADIAAGTWAIGRLAHLLSKIGAGTPRPGLVEREPTPRGPRRVRLRLERVSALLGVEVPPEYALGVLRALGFTLEASEPDFIVTVPTWRLDVSREADLAEEIGRHFGVERIPVSLPPAIRPGSLRPSHHQERRVREVLVGVGLSELINYSFVRGTEMDPTVEGRVALANPLTEEQDTLRTSILYPGLLAALRSNLRLGRRDVAVFEIGRCFAPNGDLPRETRKLGILLAGVTRPHHWSVKPHPFDTFDIKGLLELLWERMGVGPLELHTTAALPVMLHPGRSAVLRMDGRDIGYAGALHPDLRERFDLRDEPIVAEIDLDVLGDRTLVPVPVKALDRYPAISRDLSIVCDEGTPAAEIDAKIRAAAGQLLRSVSIVDRYTGNQVPAGKVSLTLSLRYQDVSRTLTSDEVQASVEDVVRALRDSGAEIRGE